MGWFTKSVKETEFEKKQHLILQALSEQIAQLSTKLTPESDPNHTGERLGELKNQFDDLELRFETLKTQCLRYLQTASRRLQKAQQLEGFEEDDEEPSTIPVPELNPHQVEEESETDLEYVQKKLREQGIQPVSG